MTLEAAIVDYLSKDNLEFGKQDYISHQVVASPFKPIDYMDKMDIFSYSYVNGFKTINNYLIIELKKDIANEDTVNQVMKYVDWVTQEYSHNDYGMIQASIIAHNFSPNIKSYIKNYAIRNYSKNKPTINKKWSDLTLFKYQIIKEEIIITKY